MGVVLHVQIPPGAVDAVEGVRGHGGGGVPHARGVQGHEVGVAAHEAHPAPVGNHLQDVAGQERAAALGAGGPVQHRAPLEVAAAAHQRHALHHLARFALPEADRRIGAHHPLAVGGVKEDGGVKGARPFHHRRVVVRVRDGDRGQAAQRAHDVDRRVVQQRDAVPQDVARRGAKEERALADGEARLRADPVQPRLQSLKGVAVRPPKLGEREPALAAGADVLPLVHAHRARVRRRVGGRELGSAGGAEIRLHGDRGVGGMSCARER